MFTFFDVNIGFGITRLTNHALRRAQILFETTRASHMVSVNMSVDFSRLKTLIS